MEISGLDLHRSVSYSAEVLCTVQASSNRPGKVEKMKKFVASTFLSIAAFCLVLPFSSLKAHADSVTLKLVGTGGQSSENVYVYPYDFSVNGSTSTTALMCLSYNNDIQFGESWEAAITAVTTPKQEEAAWLFNDANIAISEGNTALQIDDQFAAWELFATNVTPPDAGAATQLSLAAEYAPSEPASFYRNFVLYIPASGWPSGDDVPQSFIGNDPPDVAPEPSSLTLFGSGLLIFAAAFYRKRLAA
jgi:hypothetical protein